MFTPKEKRAYHEAGHVIAHWYFNLEVPYVTIIPNKNNLGSTGGITIKKIEEFEKEHGEDKAKKLSKKAAIIFLAGVESVKILSNKNPKMNTFFYKFLFLRPDQD